jgi:hypothetical protein
MISISILQYLCGNEAVSIIKVMKLYMKNCLVTLRLSKGRTVLYQLTAFIDVSFNWSCDVVIAI